MVPDQFVHQSLLILSGQCTLKLLCQHLLIKLVCLLFSVLSVNVQDIYSKTAFTLELNNLILVTFPVILDLLNLSIVLKTDLFWLSPV